MNPLSTWTYYHRHKRHAALLLSLSTVVTVGLYSLVALVWAIYVEPGRLAYKAHSEFSLVTPRSTASGPDPAVLTRLESNPDIAEIIPSTFIRIELPGMMPGHGFQFDLLGLRKEDVPYLLNRVGATVKEGRMPQSDAAELVLSEDVARILDLQVGDSYVVTSFEFYTGMDAPPDPTPFEVVGILDSDTELGILSLEFLRDHEQYRQLPARFLVVAHDGRQAAVDAFLRSQILTPGTSVMTQQMLGERIRNEALPGLAMLLPVVLIVAAAFSLVIVVVNQLANARRLPEFGILHATGHSRSWLTRRLAMETTTLALVGWLIGIGLSYLGLSLLKVTAFAARGHDLSYLPWLPVAFSLPVPATIAAVTFLSVRRTFSRLDPVAIVERRELGQEGHRRQEKRARASSPKPLAPATYYGRHRRRALLLVGGMGLMILAVTLFVFALALSADAQEPLLGYLRRVSIVRSPNPVHDLDPDVVARLATHPAVERTIPIAPRNHVLSAAIPPFTSAEASPFGVYARDMAYLVELFALELKEGRLPQPGSNEMVIPEALAQNRNLAVGDVIGDPDQPAYPGAPALETEFVISGIFARPADPEEENWLGFVSLEYLESSGPFPQPRVPPLIVVPKAGQKDALDAWLEGELAGRETSVLTYRRQISRVRDKARQDMLAIALLQVVIATVAAAGLAVLNHVFFAQRHAEFGVLHALGHSRRRLVQRVVGETALTTGIAWGVTAIVCLGAILGVRWAVFGPMGLTFDLFNPTPWLYTLPIPVLVLAVTAGTAAWTLSKLDPVSIIERRQDD